MIKELGFDGLRGSCDPLEVVHGLLVGIDETSCMRTLALLVSVLSLESCFEFLVHLRCPRSKITSLRLDFSSTRKIPA